MNDKVPMLHKYSIINLCLVTGLALTSQIQWCISHNRLDQLPVRVIGATIVVLILVWPVEKLLRFLGRRYWLQGEMEMDKAVTISLMPLLPLILIAGFPVSEKQFNFAFNLGLSGFLSSLLSGVFIAYGTALCNRRQLARQFVPLTMITMSVISYVGGSLALSLGLVGALSIVRFRTAIKDPEELVYLFASLAIGLGMGGGYPRETALATLILLCFLIGRGVMRVQPGQNAFHLTLQVPDGQPDALEKYTSVIQKCLGTYSLRRVDHTNDSFEATFIIDVPSTDRLNQLMNLMRKEHPKASLVILDGQALPTL